MSFDPNLKSFLAALELQLDPYTHVEHIEQIDNVVHIQVSKEPTLMICPRCSNRMLSKALVNRTLNHPILQQPLRVKIHLKQRKWKCPVCGLYKNDSFHFAPKSKQSTNLTVYMVLQAMKDLNRTTVDIARQFNLSDTQVHNIFTANVDLKRLPLSRIICVDEVYLNISDDARYAFVIMDFETGQIIDILQNRYKSTLENYFYNISFEERKRVGFVISDGYSLYQHQLVELLPNAKPVLDPFHVIQRLNNEINKYILSVYRHQKSINLKRWMLENPNKYREDYVVPNHIKAIKTYSWFLLKNYDDIYYRIYRKYNPDFRAVLDTKEIEARYLAIDPQFPKIKQLKKIYTDFNQTSYEKVDEAKERLIDLIHTFENSESEIFRSFSQFLKKNLEGITNSFYHVDKIHPNNEKVRVRLYNGPIEGFNRKPKDFKRNSRGFSNFDYTRNRILWATREQPSLLSNPKPPEQIHSYKKKKRRRKK